VRTPLNRFVRRRPGEQRRLDVADETGVGFRVLSLDKGRHGAKAVCEGFADMHRPAAGVLGPVLSMELRLLAASCLSVIRGLCVFFG